MDFNHISVLLDECIENLNIKPDGVYVDCTMGGAGHSREIAKRLSTSGKLICFDQDIDAIKVARERLKEFSDRVIFIHSNFENIKKELFDREIFSVDGILADLGVSSYQLDEGDRGFSYQNNARLDMRMDNRNSISAWEVVNTYSEDDLNRVIKDYGEEKWSRRIAKFIVEKRQEKDIDTTFDLVDIIKAAIPKKARDDGHPARRTFQAIRIEVNRELDVINTLIRDGVDMLKKDGRICIITFHSLEDRIVKNEFKYLEKDCICPQEILFCNCDKKSEIKIITKKPILPTESEIEKNPRSRSAKLRVAQKR